MRRTNPSPFRRSAFTLIEAIVVIVIMGILAGTIVPRVLNMGERQGELEAKAVRSLLTIAAEKTGVMNRPVALDYVEATTGTNSHGARLTLWVQVEDAKAALDTTGAARVKWVPDPLSDMVELSRLKIASALQDGGALAGGKWRVTFTPGHPRPAVEMRLESVASGGTTWVVTLPPDETSAVLMADSGATSAKQMGPARTVDLDDTGKGDAKW